MVTSGVANGWLCLLVVDGCSSHFTWSFLEYTKEKGIVVICLPPHTTHVLQSQFQTCIVVIILTKPIQTHFCVALDVVGFSQFKCHYETQMEEHMSEQLCQIMKEEFLTVITELYHMAFTPENIKKSYKTTRTWPVN